MFHSPKRKGWWRMVIKWQNDNPELLFPGEGIGKGENKGRKGFTKERVEHGIIWF